MIPVQSAMENLIHAVVQSCSDMLFIDVVQLENSPLQYTDTDSVFRIYILKPEPGEIVLVIPETTKRKILNNLYNGDAAKVKQNTEEDCFLEMLNVITGSFLNLCFGKEKIHSVSIPDVLSDYNEITLSEYQSLMFDAEGHSFVVLMRME